MMLGDVSGGGNVTIRGCALDNGGVTGDTELARVSMCGYFSLDTMYVKGCIQNCKDYDGCNSSSIILPNIMILSIILLCHVLCHVNEII